jgi:hypothetical protein
MKFAYADPPYLGQGRHYGEHPEAKTWDDPETHFTLIDRLLDEFPDGWALSASSPSLKVLLPYCPDDTRIAAWVKPMHVYKKGVRPSYSWEPVLFRGGRNQNPPTPEKGGAAITPKDHLVQNITLRKGLVGAKPPQFCRWLLDLLGYQDGDEIVDLFPGTGVMDVVAGNTPLQDGLFAEAGGVQ